MDFGGSFTTLFHLEIFVSTVKLLNITILLMNFSYYEWILVALLLRFFTWKSSCLLDAYYSTWIFAIFFKFILVWLFSLISRSQPFVNVQRHLFTIFPSLPPPGCCLKTFTVFTILPSLPPTSCCLKTFIYCITLLATTWLLFKDICLLYYLITFLACHHLVAV